MKKFLAFLLAMMVAMSMFTFAFADEGADDPTTTPEGSNDSKLTDEKTFSLPKVYFLKNSNTDSPAATFYFTITKIGVSDSDYYNPDNMPTFDGTFSVTYADDVAVSTEGVKIVSTYDLPTYTAPGIFTYRIEELASDIAGVTLQRYDGDNNLTDAGTGEGALYLVVTVARGDDGLCRVVHVHYEDDQKEKFDAPGENKLGVLNLYSAGQLTVTKTVTGNMGDQTKNFEMTITLNAPAGKKVASTITYYVKDAQGATVADSTQKIEGFGDATSKTFKVNLKHGQTLVIDNIPYGVTYSVQEADYTTPGAGGYDAPVYTLNGNLTSSNKTGENANGATYVSNEKMDSASETVGIKNNKGMQINTGLVLDTLPYVILLAVAVAGVVVMMMKKRASRED